MPTNCSNWLASTCSTFVSYRSVRKRNAQQRRGSDYYLQTNDGKLVLVASSIERSKKNLRYIVNHNFIICYSSMFSLGTIFAWHVCGQFKYWLESLINCTPRYIQPHMRAINQLAPQTHHFVHHPCWFLAPIKLQSNAMQVRIPSLYQRYIYAPNQAVILIKSGRRSYYAKIEDFVITLGWETIVIDHTFGQNYTALFGSIGHLMFDMFIFDHEGNSVQYNWSTTEPVEHPNAPPNFDFNQVLANVTGSTPITACTPKQFRQFNAEYRFCKKLTIANWFAMELCPSVQELAYVECVNQFVVRTQQRAWYIWYTNGRLEGLGWESFASAHALKEDDTIVVTVDNDLSLVAMVFDQDGCERTYYWYTDIGTDAMSLHQGVH